MVRITWTRNCFNKGYFVYFYFFFFFSFPSVFCRGAVISSRFIIRVFYGYRKQSLCARVRVVQAAPRRACSTCRYAARCCSSCPFFPLFSVLCSPVSLLGWQVNGIRGKKNNGEMAMIKATWQQCHCITGGCGLKPAAGEGFVKEPLWELMRWSEFHLVINSPLPSTCSVLWLKYC